MKLILIAIALIGSFASADMLTLLRGTYKEAGFRCEGDNTYTARDKTAGDKFFTIGDGTYFHRVELSNFKNCPNVQSAGNLNAKEMIDRVEVTPTALIEYHCPYPSGGGLYDDFAVVAHSHPITLRMDKIQGQDYLIIAGDPTYQDSDCKNPIAERVYLKQ